MKKTTFFLAYYALNLFNIILYIIAPNNITIHTLKKCITVTNAVPVPNARAIRLISASPPGAIDRNKVVVLMGIKLIEM